MKSPKTTILGVCTVLSAVCAVVMAIVDGNPNTNPDWTTTVAAVTSGIGLIFARDNNVTSEQAGVK